MPTWAAVLRHRRPFFLAVRFAAVTVISSLDEHCRATDLLSQQRGTRLGAAARTRRARSLGVGVAACLDGTAAADAWAEDSPPERATAAPARQLPGAAGPGGSHVDSRR